LRASNAKLLAALRDLANYFTNDEPCAECIKDYARAAAIRALVAEKERSNG
jgi:hypothetical protein